jgi:hypothetical protein
MSKKIYWKVEVQAEGGPKIAESQNVSVEAYDSIDVVVKAGVSEEDVQVQPGGAGQVQLLVIKSSEYSTDLTYSVNAAEGTASNRIKLDTLQMFVGDGAVGLFGATPPQTLYFYNNTSNDITIQILVGRKATTTP